MLANTYIHTSSVDFRLPDIIRRVFLIRLYASTFLMCKRYHTIRNSTNENISTTFYFITPVDICESSNEIHGRV